MHNAFEKTECMDERYCTYDLEYLSAVLVIPISNV